MTSAAVHEILSDAVQVPVSEVDVKLMGLKYCLIVGSLCMFRSSWPWPLPG